MPGSSKKTATDSRAQRDWAQNKRASGAPFGRYEDNSAKRASTASKKAIKRAGAEGPKTPPRSLMKKSPTKSVKSVMKKRSK